MPAFNTHNMEIVKAVLETAEELKSPVLLAATPGTIKYMGEEFHCWYNGSCPKKI